jgi:hypothetical protein
MGDGSRSDPKGDGACGHGLFQIVHDEDGLLAAVDVELGACSGDGDLDMGPLAGD